MKKIISCITVLCMLLSCMTIDVFALETNQQYCKVLFKLIGTAEEITGHAICGECIGRRAVFRKSCKRVAAVGQVEHLMLKKMCYTGGRIVPLTVQLEAAVAATVIGGEKRIGAAVILLGNYQHGKAVIKLLVPYFFAYAFIFDKTHYTASPLFLRK